LHWIDNETQAFLDSLVEALPATRLLLLVNYRPEYQHRWGAKTYYAQLRIDPLTGDNADALLNALLGDDLSLLPLKRLLIERTEGNPLFVEESVRTLLESVALQGSRGAYRLNAVAASIAIPATVQAILAARIDRLSPEDKRLLQAAAVIGRDVPYALLRAIAEVPDELLQRGLIELQAAEFLHEMSLFPELEYTFKHALTHEVTYGSLLHERRRALHRCILDAMERIYADRVLEQVEQLAHHAFQAEAWDKAAHYQRQAGHKAWDRSAIRTAVSAFEHALKSLARLPQTRENLNHAVGLRLLLCPQLDALLEPVRSLECAQQAQALCAALDDPLQRGRVLARLCYGHVQLGDLAASVKHGEAAFAIATNLGNAQLDHWASYWLGLAYMLQGSYRKASELLVRIYAPVSGFHEANSQYRGEHGLVRTDEQLVQCAWARSMAARCFADLGAFDSAIACAQEAERAAITLDRPWELGAANSALGRVYLSTGDLELASSRLEHCLQIAQEADIPMLRIMVAPDLGHAYNLLGRISESIALLEQARDLCEATRHMPVAPLIYAHLGEAYAAAARTQQAALTLQHAVDLARQHGMRGFEAWALYLGGRAMALTDPDNFGSVEQRYRDAAALAHELGMRPLEAQCHVAVARYTRETGTNYTSSI
jgi:tetratricopeptide (TPR) repeat protein